MSILNTRISTKKAVRPEITIALAKINLESKRESRASKDNMGCTVERESHLSYCTENKRTYNHHYFNLADISYMTNNQEIFYLALFKHWKQINLELPAIYGHRRSRIFSLDVFLYDGSSPCQNHLSSPEGIDDEVHVHY